MDYVDGARILGQESQRQVHRVRPSSKVTRQIGRQHAQRGQDSGAARAERNETTRPERYNEGWHGEEYKRKSSAEVVWAAA
jgi:hypothetical protein